MGVHGDGRCLNLSMLVCEKGVCYCYMLGLCAVCGTWLYISESLSQQDGGTWTDYQMRRGTLGGSVGVNQYD